MSKYVADKDLDLEHGANRIHFDVGEEKELNLPEGFELPEGLSEAKVKKEAPAKVEGAEKGSSKKK